MESAGTFDGGTRIAQVLARRGVRFLFTLIGGHISPIVVACKSAGIRVVDVRHEATAVFAADAVARLSGVPGVAAVTAGPGLTNTVTALKNAQLAQSPLVVLGGATASILKGRGALQDIDQLALIKPHVKYVAAVRRVRDLAPALERALDAAQSGVPGPAFVECPVDLLYPEQIVREWYAKDLGSGPASLQQRALRWYADRYLDRTFDEGGLITAALTSRPRWPGWPSSLPATVAAGAVRRAAGMVRAADRPVLIVGSQAMSRPAEAQQLAAAVDELGIPVFLAGMARGLLGRDHPRQLRRGRKKALKRADLVVLAGVPCDFRLGYGRQIPGKAQVISANLSLGELFKNRIPQLPVLGSPGRFLIDLARRFHGPERTQAPWLAELRAEDHGRGASCLESCDHVDPINLCRHIDGVMDPDDSVVVVDGGDFVATASYIVRPTGPLSWLDPGVFGTLGVGAGFALGARLCRPDSEVWLLYGDGSLGYSLVELDTFRRHGLPVIAVVGNDASWAQIARDQVALLGDDVATTLARTSYHEAARGLGAEGLLIETDEAIPSVLAEAREIAASGRPVLVNALLSTTDARAGSISI